MGQESWAVYCRISQARRRDSSGKTYVEVLGIERQEPPCRELVERRSGETLNVYVDNDLSAYSGKRRPAYEAMLDDVEAGRVQGIAAWHPDRLTRQPIENERLIALAEAHGTKFATVQAGEHDLSTPDGRLMFRMQGAMARRESEHKAARLMLKHDQKAAAGAPHGHGNRPFGYAADGVTVVEAEAELIREAATRILDHQEPVAVVLADWKQRQVVSPRGNLFKSTPLRGVLTSPRIAGLRQHRGQVVGPTAWPAIIDATTRNRLLDFYRKREGRPAKGQKAGPGQRVGRPSMKLYAGLVVCGRCGGRMFPHNKGNGIQQYFCPKGSDHDGCALSVNAGDFEAVMNEATIQWIAGPAFTDRLNRQLAALATDDSTPEQIEADQLELAELEVVLPTRFAGDSHRARYAELQARVRDAEARVAAMPELAALRDIPRAEDALRTAWAAWTTGERQRVLRAVLERVVIGPGVRGHFRGERISPHWKR